MTQPTPPDSERDTTVLKLRRLANFADDNNQAYVNGLSYQEIRAIADTLTTLRQRADKLEAALRELIPSNISLFNPNMPDETILPCDIALGSFRRAKAALGELT